MAYSSILGADPARPQPSGRDAEALGPSDNSDSGQRVLGDYQQMIAVGDRLYGVFTGTGVAFGRSVVSQDPIFFIADCPCPPGWNLDSCSIIRVSKLAVLTGIWPLK